MGVIRKLRYLGDLLFADEHAVKKLSGEAMFAKNLTQYRIL
jgi:hypothetical protein